VINVDGIDKDVCAGLKVVQDLWEAQLPKIESMPDADFKREINF
jgi:hypothetical protein